MSEFDKWYETYDRDSGELMLFNSIDLEAAWNAAMLHAAELAKEAKPNKKDLSREEWIAVEITHDAVMKAIYNGLSN